jgi:Flp pilus assembly protein TadG
MRSTRRWFSDSLSFGLRNLRDDRRRTIAAMTTAISRLSRTAIVQCAVRLRTDRNGSVAVMMGVLLPVLAGALGLGFEVANWYRVTRSMQNAADSAAIAAATNNSSNYNVEALAVAAQYGFVNGANNVTVTATNPACPSGVNPPCYSVTITGMVLLYLSQVVGYKGTTTVNGVPQTSLSAAAVATTQGGADPPLCLLALGTSGGTDIVTNGNPKANMTGCNVMSDANATCNGSNLGAPFGLAHGTNTNCGVVEYSNVPVVTDPYKYLASDIPANAISSCGGSFPQETKVQGKQTVAASNQWTGAAWPSGAQVVNSNGVTYYVMCGDVQLTGNVTVNAPSGAVLIIENGQLDLNGNTLTTSSGSGLTLVFSGTNGGTYTHAPTDTSNGGGGVCGSGSCLDIAAPTSGVWSGMAIYQDPALTTGVNISAAGNSPTWEISGTVYLPNSIVTISGAINKASNGLNCFVMVMDQITINGTGDVLAGNTPTNCSAAGVTTPSATLPRGKLVL